MGIAIKRPNASPRAAVWLVATVLCLAGSLPLFGALAQPGSSASDVVDEYFDGGHVARPDRLLSIDGFTPGDRGWYLSPGASGRLVYRVPRQTGSAVGLSVWLYALPGVTNAVLASTGSEAPVTLLNNVNGEGIRVVLPRAFDSAQSVVIEIDARNSSLAQVLVIDQVVTYSTSGTDARAPPVLAYVAFGGLVALIKLALLRRRRHALALSAAMGIVVGTATAARCLQLFAVNGPLDPDAVAYRTYADHFQWWPFSGYGLFSGNFMEREPVFPMVVHAYFQALGSSDFHLRVVSVTLSTAVVILSVVAARRRLLRWPAALLVGFLLAVSGPLIEESVRGLRLELEMVVLLLLYLALDRGPSKRPLLDAIVVGSIGAVMVLTRTYYLPVFVAAVGLAFLVRYRPSWRSIGLVGVALAIMVAGEGAHRLGLYEHHGDAFYDTSGYVRWLANYERFANQRPLPHPELFPTAEQYQQFGPYFGPKISTPQYLFVIHSPVEFARDSLAGSREIFDTIDGTSVLVRGTRFTALDRRIAAGAAFAALRVDLATRWLILLGLMALVVRGFRHPHMALIPLIVVSWMGLSAFLVDHGVLERYRHTWQTMPLALIAGAWLLQSTVVEVRRGLAVPKRLVALYRRVVPDIDLALFPASMVLALALTALPSRFLLADALLLGLAVGVLTYRRPAAGTAAMLLAVSVGGNVTPVPVEAAALVPVAWRLRPPVRSLSPLLAFVPFGLAVLLAGGRPTLESLNFVASMLLVAATVAIAVRRPDVRQRLMWLITAIGPLAGLAYGLEPAAPTAIALAPIGAVVAACLYTSGHRRALALGMLDLVVVVLVNPVFAWLGVLVAVAWLTWDRTRWPARRKVAMSAAVLAGLIALGVGASLAATTPPPGAAWGVRLTDTSSAIQQRITVDRTGENSIWFYGRRASSLSDYAVVVDVNGASVTGDLNSYLPATQPAWSRLALSGTQVVGKHLLVQVRATGQPDAINRFIEIGGVYATVADLASAYSNGSQLIGANGTYLIVLGDDSQPLAPAGLPEPLIQGRWQPPLGQWMPGERGAPTAAREQANTSQLWSSAFTFASQHPLGIGTGNLANAFNALGAGFGPGLSARNEFLQAAAEWGLPGLAGLVLVIGAAAWGVRRSGYRLGAALLLLVVVSMAGESLLADSAGAVAAWVTIALCLAVTPTGAISPSTSTVSSGEKQRSTSP